MNRGMNAFLHSLRYRALKHGSEEEYDMFEEIAVCRARNRRMNGAAESRLQLQPITPAAPPGRDEGASAAAITPHTRGDGNALLVPEDSSRCAEDGKRSEAIVARASRPADRNTAATNEANGFSGVVVFDDRVSAEADEFIPSPSSDSSSDHDPSEECSKEDEVWPTCCLQ